MRKTTLLIILTISIIFSNAQTTAIPDSLFEWFLIDKGYDTYPTNGSVPTANISNITTLSMFSNYDVRDLTGIEDFSSLTYLDCSDQELSNLDVSQNVSLTYLNCRYNSITSLDLSQNVALTYLNCSYNSLTSLNIPVTNSLSSLSCNSNQLTSLNITQNPSLDTLYCYQNDLTNLNISQNPNLTRLFCHANQLSSLDLTQNNQLHTLWSGGNPFGAIDVTQNLALCSLDCGGNQLTNLDVTQNTALIYLSCGSNLLTTLDVTQNGALTTLWADHNQLTSLNVSQNPNLYRLECGYNQLTSLNVSQNPNLRQLDCGSNQLNCLNVKNGNNWDFSSFNTLGQNGALTCTEVDDPSWAYFYWYNMSPSFSTNCNNSCSNTLCVMDAGFTFVDNGNGNYSFTNTSTGNYTLMDWSFGDGTSSLLSNPSHTFIGNGDYTVVLAVADSSILTQSSCIDYYYTTLNVSGVSNPPQCNAGFSIYPDTTYDHTNIINSSIGSNLTYSWNFGDGSGSTSSTPVHTYYTPGPFYLCLTIDDGNGCLDTYCDSIGNKGIVFKAGGFKIKVTTLNPIGISENITSNFISYPNPTSGKFTIDLGEVKQDIKATLTNSLGQVILTKTYISTNSINIEIEAPTGIYFLQLESDEEVITKKIIKE